VGIHHIHIGVGVVREGFSHISLKVLEGHRTPLGVQPTRLFAVLGETEMYLVLVRILQASLHLLQFRERVVVGLLSLQDAVQVLRVDNFSAGVGRRHFCIYIA